MSAPVRIAVAQCAPALGALGRNLAMHREWIAQSRAAGARLVVFPELSLTGYRVQDLAAELAMRADDPRLEPIAEASREIDVVAGFIERAASSRLHIASGYWSGGALRHVHRKVYLPTYGMFQEGRWFAPGERFDLVTSPAGPAGLVICEELWHVSVPYLYAVAGAAVLLSPHASPGRGVAEGPELGTAASCRLMTRFYAQHLTVHVVFANRVGVEDGATFWGGSEVVAPDGTLVARAADLEEELLVADLDPGLVDRERDRNPLLRDERPDLVLRALTERLGLSAATE